MKRNTQLLIVLLVLIVMIIIVILVNNNILLDAKTTDEVLRDSLINKIKNN